MVILQKLPLLNTTRQQLNLQACWYGSLYLRAGQGNALGTVTLESVALLPSYPYVSLMVLKLVYTAADRCSHEPYEYLSGSLTHHLGHSLTCNFLVESIKLTHSIILYMQEYYIIKSQSNLGKSKKIKFHCQWQLLCANSDPL